MVITTDEVKELREKTGISVMQCKRALEEAGGDMEKALIVLKKRSKEVASKKGEREFGAGVVASYIHGDGRIGVLLKLSCETDFVAKNLEFKELANDIAMHVAAMDPQFLRKEDITDIDREKVEEVFAGEIEKMEKPQDVKKKILEGKLDSYFKEKILLEQPFIKETEITVLELIERAVLKTGERIEISKFVRFSI